MLKRDEIAQSSWHEERILYTQRRRTSKLPIYHFFALISSTNFVNNNWIFNNTQKKTKKS